MNAVPFALNSLYEGLAHCHGLIRDEGDHLLLEFQVRDALLGVIKGRVRKAAIPLKELASVGMERRWLGMRNRIVIQANRMEAVKDVPCMEKGRLVLSIARKDLPAARAFVDGLHVEDAA